MGLSQLIKRNACLLVNLIIAMQGILILTNGAHRQRFYQIYSQFTRGQEEEQKLGEVIIIVASLFMFTFILSKSIVLRLISMCVYALYVCFMYNVAKYHTASDLAKFITEMLILGLGVTMNADSYLEQQVRKQNLKRLASNQSVTSRASTQSKTSIMSASSVSNVTSTSKVSSVSNVTSNSKVSSVSNVSSASNVSNASSNANAQQSKNIKKTKTK